MKSNLREKRNGGEITSLELSPHIVGRGRVLVSCSSYFVYKDVIMVWQVKQHHASHYVTSVDCHNYSYSYSDINYCYVCGPDVEALVIVVRCCYQAHAHLMTVESIIYIPRSVNGYRQSTRYCIWADFNEGRKINFARN